MLVFFATIAACLAALGLGYWMGQRPAAALSAELAQLRAQENALRERAARAEQAEADAKAQLGQDHERLGQLKAQFSAEAARLLGEKSGELRQEAGRHFEGVMAPLRQNLEDLKRLQENGQRGQTSLSEQLRGLTEAHASFSAKAEQLSFSLKGNVKGQGIWGEQVLERVLELSGMSRGIQYVLQGEGLDLRDENGALQKPDAVVLLPDGKQLIVDAKAPIDGYLSSLSATSEEERRAGAQSLAKALRAQAQGLSQRKYYANAKLSSPEFTLMFVPIEAALGVALQEDPQLFEAAWEKRVIVVGPNMLFGTLKVIGQLWSQEKRNKNAEEIAKRAGALYDKLAGFADDFSKAKLLLNQAQSKLVEGPGNVIAQVQKLKELGAKADKALPQAWLEAAGESAEAQV